MKRSGAIALASLVLLLQAAAFYRLERSVEPPLNAAPLGYFPEQLGPWSLEANEEFDSISRETLKPDAFLFRTYQRLAGEQTARLTVVYFRSQGVERTPHAPRNCLVGHGWIPNEASVVDLPAVGTATRYQVARQDESEIVLYWYQSARGVIGNDFVAKFWLLADAVASRRSDGALVLLEVPVTPAGRAAADRAAMEFARLAAAALEKHFPKS